MKKLYLFSALFLSFCLFAACFAPLVETGERVSEDVFRLHILANSDTKADQDLKLLVRDDVLQACTARVVREYFNTRVYENVTLPAGYYNALKIEIGAGAGHNWWCVLFPAVCLSACTKEDLSAYLDEDEVRLIENGDCYAVRFKAIEIYQKIKENLK